MKKRAAAVLLAAMVLGQNVTAAETVNVLKSEMLEISGKCENKFEDVAVMVLKDGKTLSDVEKEGTAAVLYVDQTETDSNGNYTFEINKNKISDDSEIYVFSSNSKKLVRGGKAVEIFNIVKKDGVEIIGESNEKLEDITIMVLKSGKTFSEVETEGKEAVLHFDQTETDNEGRYSFYLSRNQMTGGDTFNFYISTDSGVINEGKIDLSEDVENKKAINVMDYGADNTGAKDNTFLLEKLHSTGRTIYYPEGTYRFNGRNLDISGGVVFEDRAKTKVVNDISDENILQFDDFGNFVGLQQNHLEQSSKENGTGWRMDIGNLASPPLSAANYKTKVDFIPYWYNDFGLERTIANGTGSSTWYYWDWNFHSNKSDDPAKNYDAERHPLLGYYRGDDATVLEWQCYWMKEYGINTTILMGTNDSPSSPEEWSEPTNSSYWIYQLLNNVPNFKNMQYIMLMPTLMRHSDSTVSGGWVYEADNLKQWWSTAIEDIYGKYDNCYVIEKDGKKYPVVYLLDESVIFVTLNNSEDAVKQFFKAASDKFKTLGYDGFAMFSRNESSRITAFGDWFEENDILRYITKYEPLGDKSSNTYENMVNNYVENYNAEYSGVSTPVLANAFTGAYTHSPHPSGWNAPGNTPELFEKLVKAQVEMIEEKDMPKIITCYNVAEWAEGGPGLQPNMKNGFAYLEAVKNAVVKDPQMSLNTIWYDEDNLPVNSFSSKEDLVQKTDIYNTCYNGEKAVVITALYNGSTLVDVFSKTVETTGKKTEVEFEISKEKLKGATQIKVMAFDGFENIIPLSAINTLK